MPIPIPPKGPTGTQQGVGFYAGLVKQYFGASASQQYVTLYNQYQNKFPPTTSQSTAYQIFDIFAGEMAVGGGMKKATQAVGQGISNIGQGTANSLGWLGSLGGMIGSGIEAGLVTFFKDLWDVIVGPVEVILGVLLALVLLIWYFRTGVSLSVTR